MSDTVLNIVLGVVSSAVSAALAWLLQTALRRRSLERERDFFGLPQGGECTIVVPRHVSSQSDNSVNQRDVLALMELATLVRQCGARLEVVPHDKVGQGLGTRTEFCVGGPMANARTAAHLRWKLPGVRIHDSAARDGSIVVGSRAYGQNAGVNHVLLSRITAGEGGRPTFLICGQTAISNIAGVRYLARHHRELARRYGRSGSFSLLLRVVQPEDYGADVTELVGDVTAEAGAAPPASESGSDGPEPGASAAPEAAGRS